MTFEEVRSAWTWRPIPNCPGRFILTGGATKRTPQEIIAADVQVSEFLVTSVRDPVVVALFDDGGLISYRKKDGTYLHTLNTVEGFERKLSQLGIEL